MQPDVSIIVAAYNAAATIERALSSALATKAVSFEIVVADDASSDDTAAVVERMADPRVRLLRGTVNRGPGGARNLALAKAEGRYVSILDADDTIHPDRLERVVERLDASGAAIVVDGVEVDDASTGVRTTMEGATSLPPGFEIDLPYYLKRNVLFGSTFTLGYLKPTIRRSVLADLNIVYGDLRIGEDFLLIAEILARGERCIVEPTVGYTYNITQGSISRILERRHIIAMRDADDRFRERLALGPSAIEALDERRRAFDDGQAFVTMVEALKSRDPRAFARQALARPSALALFRMPLTKRLGKLRRVVRAAR